MTKIVGSGSATGSISQRHGSADPNPDPHQNVMDRNTGFSSPATSPVKACLNSTRVQNEQGTMYMAGIRIQSDRHPFGGTGLASRACRSGSISTKCNAKVTVTFSRKFQNPIQNIENYGTYYEADKKDKQ
jgi:hypothetical protein